MEELLEELPLADEDEAGFDGGASAVPEARTELTLEDVARLGSDAETDDVYHSDIRRAMLTYPERMSQSFMDQAKLVDALFDTSKQLILLVDNRGSIGMASRFVSTALGHERSSAVGADWLRLLVPAYARTEAADLLDRAVANGRAFGRLAVVTRMGTHLLMELNARSLADRGERYAFLLTGTLVERDEGDVERGDVIAETTRRVLESMGEAVLAVEPDTRSVVDCNREAATLFGRPEGSIRGAPLATILGVDADGRDPMEAMLDAQSSRGFLSIERTMERKAGAPFSASLLAVPVLGGNGSLARVLFIVKDVSAAKQLENERGFIVGRLRELARTIAGLGERLDFEQPKDDGRQWKLTPRQKDVARCVAAGMANKQIASTLGLSEASVKVHVYAIYKKLGVRSRVEFLTMVRERGFSIT